jgi:hypothetical protein
LKVLCPAGNRGYREPPGERLAEHHQVRQDAVELLRATWRETEAGDHFVENQQGAVLGAHLLEHGQEARSRLDATRVAHHRFADGRGDALALGREQVPQPVLVVPGQHPQPAAALAGEALAPRAQRRRIPAPIFAVRRFPQHAVVPTVVVARELQDQRAAGVGARQPQGGVGRLRAGRTEAHLVGARHHGANGLRHFGREGVLGGEDPAAADLLFDGPAHDVRAVAEDQGALAQGQVQVAPSAGVPDVRALAAVGEEGLRGPARVAAHAVGQATPQPLAQPVRLRSRLPGHPARRARHGHHPRSP